MQSELARSSVGIYIARNKAQGVQAEADGESYRLEKVGRASAVKTEADGLAIAKGLREMIRVHTPQTAAVEEVFYAQNVQTALKLSHARGVALLVVAEAGLSLGEYSPLEVKISVVGYGRAEKQQVKLMVHSLLALQDRIDSEDACDAIAVAICHATRASTQMRLRAAKNITRSS